MSMPPAVDLALRLASRAGHAGSGALRPLPRAARLGRGRAVSADGPPRGARPPQGGGERSELRGETYPHLVETRIDSERVFDGKLLHVRRDTVRLPSGREATREYITHPGAVLVAPRLADGRWVVERQFRYPVGRVFVEFPAGKIDAGEAPIDTGRRELREEAGLEAARWTRLGAMHPCIGYATR